MSVKHYCYFSQYDSPRAAFEFHFSESFSHSKEHGLISNPYRFQARQFKNVFYYPARVLNFEITRTAHQRFILPYVSFPLSSPLSVDDPLSLQATAFLVMPVKVEKETIPKVNPIATAIAIINLLMNNLLYFGIT